LPLAWQVVPQQAPWPDTLADLLPPLLAPIAAALPADCRVTLLGDRGLSGPTLIDAARALGWDVLLRVNVDASQAHRLRLASGEEWRLWDWVEQVGSGWHGPVAIFKDAGWRAGHLTIHRRAGMTAWWILFSTRPGGRERVREYAQRARVEATFADGKTRGWGLDRSRMRDPIHLDRLLLVWHLALWWLHALGRHVIKQGGRSQFDRVDRRDRSLIRLGWLWLQHGLVRDRCPPLLFRSTPDGAWRARGAP
ncbi:MAG TPA: transposase, partial [Thermomicrobiales bacterium]|nr:transposase [Thermomicrobiales bacterium]